MTSQEEHENQHYSHMYPAYELRWEDFLGIGCLVVSNVFGAVAGGFAAIGNEFLAAARFNRAWVREVARREELDRRFGDIAENFEAATAEDPEDPS